MAGSASSGRAGPRGRVGNVARNPLGSIQERFTEAAAAWLERLDLHVPAFAVSLAFHVVLVLVLATLATAVPADLTGTFQTEMVVGELPDLSRLEETELVETDRVTTLEPVAGTFAPRLSPLL